MDKENIVSEITLRHKGLMDNILGWFDGGIDSAAYIINEHHIDVKLVAEVIAVKKHLNFYSLDNFRYRYELSGFKNHNEYYDSDFYRCFVNGGIFFINNIDQIQDGSLHLYLKQAVDKRTFTFLHKGGMSVSAHKDFHLIVSGETNGHVTDDKGHYKIDNGFLDCCLWFRV